MAEPEAVDPDRRPIDAERPTPAAEPGVVDQDSITADIDNALRRAVDARIDRVVEQRGIGRRAAAIVVLGHLRIR